MPLTVYLFCFRGSQFCNKIYNKQYTAENWKKCVVKDYVNSYPDLLATDEYKNIAFLFEFS